MSEKGTEPDIELRCVNVAEVPKADIPRGPLNSFGISIAAACTKSRGLLFATFS
jgi:hypothetical protein